MLLRFQPRRDDAAALAFDDVASALDAGLQVAALGGDPAAGEHALYTLFAARGIALDATEHVVLAAAWTAGRASDALRRMADGRRARAAFARDLFGRLRYPAAIALMTLFAATTAGLTLPGGRWLLALAWPTIAAGLLVFVLLLRGVARGDSHWLRLPFIASWARDLGELPYLEVLRGLYGSGVPLLSAHPRAVAACPVAEVQQRLRSADAILQQRRPLRDALHHAGALHAETRQLVAAGEQAGELEQALSRALVRRREVAARGAARLGATLGTAAYVFATAVAVAVVFSAYASIFGRLR